MFNLCKILNLGNKHYVINCLYFVVSSCPWRVRSSIIRVLFCFDKNFLLQNSLNNFPLFFHVQEIDKLLTLSTEAFLEGDGVEIDMKKREVWIIIKYFFICIYYLFRATQTPNFVNSKFFSFSAILYYILIGNQII